MSKPDPKQDKEDIAVAHIGMLYQSADQIRGSFEGQILAHAHFKGLDLRSSDFRGANLMGAKFVDCDLRDAIFHYAQLESVHFINCRLDRGDFRGAEISYLFVGQSDEDVKQLKGESSMTEQTHQVRYVISRGFLYEVFCWIPPQLDQRKSAARPLIIFHGMTGHALDFEQLAHRAERPVYALNLLGHGVTSYLPLSEEAELVESEESTDRSAPLYEEVVEQVIDVIVEVLTSSKATVQSSTQRMISFDLMGYSLGGRLALHVSRALQGSSKKSKSATNHIQLTQILVIGASLGLSQEKDREVRRQADRQWSDPLWVSTSTNEFLRVWNQQPLLARLQTLNPKQALKLSIHRKSHHPQGLAIAFDSLGLGEMPPLHDHLATIASPITWIYGAEDEKYEKIAQRASELHPSSTLVSIPNTGHAPHLEDFDTFWDRTSHLLRG